MSDKELFAKDKLVLRLIEETRSGEIKWQIVHKFNSGICDDVREVVEYKTGSRLMTIRLGTGGMDYPDDKWAIISGPSNIPRRDLLQISEEDSRSLVELAEEVRKQIDNVELHCAEVNKALDAKFSEVEMES